MINRATDIVPQPIIDELLRLAKLDRNWLKWYRLDEEKYTCETSQPTWLRQTWSSGADGFGLWALSLWIADGPKIFRPSQTQCDALEQVEIRLELSDYSQPYPELLIDLPEDHYDPFLNIICHHSEDILTCVLHSKGHLNDITTTIAIDNRPIEVSLHRYDSSIDHLIAVAGKVLRVAINSCLALANYGCHKELLYPKEIERDRQLTNEQTERGQRARQRLKTAINLVSFNQEVKLHKTEGTKQSSVETGKEISCHWRRGHWCMQPYGPKALLRKRILRPPVLIRADKFMGHISDTTVVYK